MRIAIFGAGGVGGYFGGRLAQAGENVSFIARGSHLQSMLARGLRVDSQKGDFTINPVQATSNAAEIGPVDFVIVGLKAWQVEAASQELKALVGPSTCVVPLQNGVETPALLGSILGEDHVIGGFCRIVSMVAGPGHISQTAGDAYIAFGELDNRPSERTRQLLAAFRRAEGVTTEIPPDIQAAMWSKFLLISSWSGMGAVTRAPVGVWRSMPETRQIWQEAMQEVLAVARAHDVALPDDIIARSTTYVEALAPQATGSMQRDILAGLPSELGTLCGGVVRLGKAVGIPTPVHTFIYSVLLPQEQKARGKVDFP